MPWRCSWRCAAMALSETTHTDIEHTFRQAESALVPGGLRGWLENQPSERIVGMPRSPMGGTLGTYLASATMYLWFACQGKHWPQCVHEAFARPLPHWALRFLDYEAQLTEPITVTLALQILGWVESWEGRGLLCAS